MYTVIVTEGVRVLVGWRNSDVGIIWHDLVDIACCTGLM